MQNDSVPAEQDMTVWDILERSARRTPDAPAIDFLGARLTYRAVWRQAERAAAGLLDQGVRKGDRVALCLPNTPYSVIMFFAILRIGAIVVNVNPLYADDEMRRIFANSGARMVVTADVRMIFDHVRHGAGDTGVEKIVICPIDQALPKLKAALYRVAKRHDIVPRCAGPRHVYYGTLIESRTVLPRVPIDPARDVAVLQYTGGTTGLPKGAMLSHRNIVANAIQIDHHLGGQLPAPQRFLGVLPLFHVFALQAVMMLPILRGEAIYLQPRFDAGAVLKCLRRARITALPAVPSILTALLKENTVRREDFASLRLVCSGGAPLPPALRARFEHFTGSSVIEGYGLSETSPVLTLTPIGAPRDGSCGTVLEGTTLQIRDPEDSSRVLPQGMAGEVCVRGPQVMLGYWPSEETADPLTEDGFLRTGDVGYLDRDGYLFLVDRLKDMIICGGYKIYPRTVEDALYLHPAVSEVIVIGVPDAYWGQVPVAYVALKPGAQVDEGALLTHLERHLSKIERPREILFRPTLPRTMIGKLSKKDLIRQEGLEAGLSARAARPESPSDIISKQWTPSSKTR